ncbi:MAG: hypothetical protein ACJASV_001317 [Pseudorhodobacter sp.]|jgi:hypothetical protein
MRKIVTATLGVWLAIAGPLMAQSQEAVVVELYTSQGCSSCPPADALLAKLTEDPRVIPLAMHVDYWDYLGWKDKFANAKFTARQKAYAHHARERMIYTPQMVIGGRARIVGSHASEMKSAIDAEVSATKQVQLNLTRSDGKVVIVANPVAGLDMDLIVQLVRYKKSESVAINRGENKGKTITYHNIVTSWQQLANWNGRAPLTLEAAAEGADPVVVIIQAEGPAEIVAAAQLR